MKKLLPLLLLSIVLSTECSFPTQTYHRFNIHYDVSWMPNPALIDSSTPTSLFVGSAEADIELVFPSEGGSVAGETGSVHITDFILTDTPCSLTMEDSLYTQELPVEFEDASFAPAGANGVPLKPIVTFKNLGWSADVELPPISVNMVCPVVGATLITADIYPLVLGIFDEYDISASCQEYKSGKECYITKDGQLTMADTLSSVPFMKVYLANITLTYEDLGETVSE
ncbi:MAG: hypothetical protein WC924_02095 [Candidatus Gracilibacteria bacterium]